MQAQKPRSEWLADLAAFVIIGLAIVLFALVLGLAVCHVFQSSADVLQSLLPFSP